MTGEGQVEKHYASESISARVLTALRTVNGSAVAITPDTLAPIDHFLARGVQATEGLPPLGEHIVTSESAREWRINVMRSSAEGRLSMIEALARKPH